MKRSIIALVVLGVVWCTGMAQNSYIPYKSFDGEHKNEVALYFMAGRNNIVDGFGGYALSYTHHFTPRWHAGGDMQMQFGKQLYSLDVQGGYCLPIKYGKLYFDGKLMYNRYHTWKFNEYVANLSATWESAYFDLRIGESLIHFHDKSFGEGYGYTEPLTFTFGIGANIRHRTNWWNIGLFFRNYDDFYYENWNINWGLRWYARVKGPWSLFGEFNVRPAGSMSQLASKYEGSGKIGVKYKL